MDALDNPYRPGAGTPPPALLGRDQLLDAFGITVRRAVTGRPGKSLMPIVGKGMIFSPAHGDTAFTVPLFNEYLRRTMPDWRPSNRA